MRVVHGQDDAGQAWVLLLDAGGLPVIPVCAGSWHTWPTLTTARTPRLPTATTCGRYSASAPSRAWTGASSGL